MREYLIGTGGWAYFQVPGLDSLVAYSRLFNFVEVNSTYYQIPPLGMAERWRKLVPADFRFSVRAHQSVLDKRQLQPELETFGKMKRICDALGADILHVQVPQSVKFTHDSMSNLASLLSSFSLGKLRLAIEIRGIQPDKLPSELLKTMQEHNAIHCIDLSRGEMPAYESDVLYTRLFGKGQHNIYQPTDGELAEMDRKASSSKSQKIVMSFHFVRMYKDAARLKTYKQTGEFPKITRSTGLSSLEEVLSEDAKLPTTRDELIYSQGWKLFDLTEHKRVHVGDFLQKLPEGTYRDITEITSKLQTTVM